MELSVNGTGLLNSGALTPQTTAVLTLSELNRMKMTLNAQKQASSREEDRRRLKQASDNRIKNWSNTIEALRNKKEIDRYEKFKREELERRRIEKEEEEYQAAEKRKLIQKAKLEVFRRHDKVKKLHSTMLMSDVLKERDLQAAIGRHKQQVEQEIEEQHHQDILEQIRQKEAEELRRQKIREEKKKQQQKVLKQQKVEFRDKYLQRMREEKLEGEIIKAKVAEAQKEAQLKEQQRRAVLKQAQADTMRVNEELKAYKLKELEKDKIEEQRIQKFAKDKAERDARIEAERKRRFDERQALKQRMIDKAVADLEQKQSKEQLLLERDIERDRQKKEAAAAAKAARLQKMQGNINRHTALTIEKKEAARKAQAAEDKDFQAFWRKKNEKIEERIEGDRKQRNRMNRALFDYQKKQAEEKQREREQELIREMEEADQINTAIENDEKMFRTYAEKCVKEWESNGKNVNPILIELKKQRMRNLENL